MVSISLLRNNHGFLIAGIQLLIIETTADPLKSASGVRAVISSFEVIGYTGSSLVGGNSTMSIG
jgi:hypothetical protein